MDPNNLTRGIFPLTTTKFQVEVPMDFSIMAVNTATILIWWRLNNGRHIGAIRERQAPEAPPKFVLKFDPQFWALKSPKSDNGHRGFPSLEGISLADVGTEVDFEPNVASTGA